MANFLETQPRRYNDYVGMPVDTYAAVGMYKQAMYEQGVQQIQTALSTVAGLDVARPVDKQYLESKVNEVASKINSIADGDWSNKNLVSKATGIASSVAKDNYVQDAIYSAAAIKQLEASQKALKEKNPELYPVSAEWYDSQELQRYMSSNKIGDRYGGPKEATRHFGKQRDEDIRKALKDLEPSITTQIGPNGKYTYTYDKSTIITPEQIRTVVDGVIASNPEYQKSLAIDGAFSYKDANTKELLTSVNEIANQELAYYDKSIDELQNFKTKNPQLSIASEEYQKYYGPNGELAKLETAKKEKIQYYLNLNDEIINNNLNTISSVKQSLFRNKLMLGYVANFQKQQVEREIKENIDAVKTEEFALKYINAGLDPDTKQPPLPGSKYYGWKVGADGKSNPSSSSTIPMAGTANTTDTYSELDTEIQNYSKSLDSLDTEFKLQYSKKYDKDFAQADLYIQEQEKRLQNGQDVDPDYLSYKKERERISVLASAFGELKIEANKLAENSVPTKNIPNKTIKGTNEVIDYSDNNLINTLYEFDKLVGEQAVSDEAVESTLISNIGVKANQINYFVGTAGKGHYYNDHAAAKVLTKFKNNPYYNKLKALVEKGYISTASEIFEPINKIHFEQSRIKDEYIKKRIGTLTPTGKTFEKGSSEEKAAASVVLNSIPRTNKEKVNIPQDVQALSVYRDPVTNQTKIDYASGPENARVKATQIIPDNSSLAFLPASSNYDYLRTAIDTSPTNKTTSLTTSNGKITYRIGKNTIGGTYYVQVKYGEDWKTLSKLDRQDIGSLYETIEQYSKIPELKSLPAKQATELLINTANNK